MIALLSAQKTLDQCTYLEIVTAFTDDLLLLLLCVHCVLLCKC